MGDSESSEISGLITTLFIFETVPAKLGALSPVAGILGELGISTTMLSETAFKRLVGSYLGNPDETKELPDVVWEKNSLNVGEKFIKVLSLTELPQHTWAGCFNALFESPNELIVSVSLEVPDKAKIKRALETKRRISHALSVQTSLEVKNIESNSVLASSEETLERIQIGKESLFDLSMSVVISGPDAKALSTITSSLVREISSVSNAGLFAENVGCLPVLKSHLPGNSMLGIRKLPVLSGNLAHLLPVVLDYSRTHARSSVPLLSRSGEISHLNLFSPENLNFNAFICGASGSGKSFLMNTLLSGFITDEEDARVVVFDVGGSYRKLLSHFDGQTLTLNTKTALDLIATYLSLKPIEANGFTRTLIETLCGSGSHITHSHRVAIEELLMVCEGAPFKIKLLVNEALEHRERYYQDIAHWLKPHLKLDEARVTPSLLNLIAAPIASFDFKELDSEPVLQRISILVLTNLIWTNLSKSDRGRTLIVFDEVWKFFSQAAGFLDEMYRTLRKYKAGIVSITQNLADYGDDSFAKLVVTNSFTKILLQNGATAKTLASTLDLSESDISRALSVVSRKPYFSEFVVMNPGFSQVMRLYPTKRLYELANTESITANQKEGNKNA